MWRSSSKEKGHQNIQQACERESIGTLQRITGFFWRSLLSVLVFRKNRDPKNDAGSQHAASHVTFVISPRKVALVLILVVLGLLAAHAGTRYLWFFQGHEYQLGFVRQLDLDEENNIPTWYSSSALLLSAILLTVTGFVNRQRGNPYTYHWLGLAVIFLYLSLDEAASLHEMTHDLLNPRLAAVGYFHGWLHWSWVVFGAIFVLIVGAVYLPFVVALPIQTRRLFLIAGTLYVGGELGMDMLGGRYDYFYGDKTFTYGMLVVGEEGLAMLGNVVFIYGLLTHLGSSSSSLIVRFGYQATLPGTAPPIGQQSNTY